ncbi:hypothetical protein ACOME3_006439 [Neoechinorhynchus agilis]
MIIVLILANMGSILGHCNISASINPGCPIDLLQFLKSDRQVIVIDKQCSDSLGLVVAITFFRSLSVHLYRMHEHNLIIDWITMVNGSNEDVLHKNPLKTRENSANFSFEFHDILFNDGSGLPRMMNISPVDAQWDISKGIAAENDDYVLRLSSNLTASGDILSLYFRDGSNERRRLFLSPFY